MEDTKDRHGNDPDCAEPAGSAGTGISGCYGDRAWDCQFVVSRFVVYGVSGGDDRDQYSGLYGESEPGSFENKCQAECAGVFCPAAGSQKNESSCKKPGKGEGAENSGAIGFLAERRKSRKQRKSGAAG